MTVLDVDFLVMCSLFVIRGKRRTECLIQASMCVLSYELMFLDAWWFCLRLFWKFGGGKKKQNPANREIPSENPVPFHFGPFLWRVCARSWFEGTKVGRNKTATQGHGSSWLHSLSELVAASPDAVDGISLKAAWTVRRLCKVLCTVYAFMRQGLLASSVRFL